MAGTAGRRRGSAPGSSCGPHVSRADRLAELIPAADLAPAQSPGPPVCTQFYRSPNKASVLEIIQTAGRLRRSETPPDGGPPIRVRGHPGHASRNVITWREDGLTDYILMIGVQNRRTHRNC